MRSFLALFIAFLLCGPAVLFSAEVTGPERVTAGRIAVFVSDVEGVAEVTPDEHVDLLEGSDGKTFYFASNIPGKYRFIFLTIIDGKLVRVRKVFEVESLPDPDEDEEPEPKPKPSPIPKLTETEKEVLIWALKSSIYHIERGNLKEPAGIRSSFKSSIQKKLLTESPAVSATLDGWSDRTNWTTAQTIKTSFLGFLEEWGVVWKGADAEFGGVLLNEVNDGASVCPGGVCPTYYYKR